jgi:hypothetical protein
MMSILKKREYLTLYKLLKGPSNLTFRGKLELNASLGYVGCFK